MSSPPDTSARLNVTGPSLVRRSALLVGLVAAGAAALAGFAIWVGAQHRLEGEFIQESEARWRMLANLVRQDATGTPYLDINVAVMPEYAPGAACGYFQMSWPGGGERSPSLSEDRQLAAPEPPLAPGAVLQADGVLPDDRRGRVAIGRLVAAPEWDSSTRPAVVPLPVSVVLTVARSRQELDQTLRSLALAAGFGIALAAVAGALAGIVVIRRGLRPLRDLERAVGAVAPRDPVAHFPESGMRELAIIGKRLNELLGGIREALGRERRFTGMAAHELRTPIAELQAACEVAARWPDDRAAQNFAISEGLRIAQELGALLAHLLALARAEGGPTSGDHAEADLTDLVAETLAHAAGLAAARPAVHLNLHPARIRGPLPLLRAIVRNLIENALVHAATDAVVAVTTVADGEWCRLVIRNPAPDLAVEDLARLGETFWRKDPARGDRTHAGLGLAFCRAAASAIGAQLAFRLDAGDLVAELRLPGVFMPSKVVSLPSG